MGIVPKDEHLLGLEGAGIFRQIGSQAHPYQVEQRVLFYRQVTIGNGVQVSKDCIHPLPDAMTLQVRTSRPHALLR